MESVDREIAPEAERGVDLGAAGASVVEQQRDRAPNRFGAAQPARITPRIERGELGIREFDDRAHVVIMLRHPMERDRHGTHFGAAR